jgi:hypothetical protein
MTLARSRAHQVTNCPWDHGHGQRVATRLALAVLLSELVPTATPAKGVHRCATGHMRKPRGGAALGHCHWMPILPTAVVRAVGTLISRVRKLYQVIDYCIVLVWRWVWRWVTTYKRGRGNRL